MKKKLMKFLKRTIEYSFYLFVFIFFWQTKIILRSAQTNFTEISVYLSYILLLIILMAFFVCKLKAPETKQKISWLWKSLVGLEMAVLISFFFAPDKFLAFYYYILFLLGVGLFYLLREGLSSVACENKLISESKIIYTFLASIFLQAVLGIYQFIQQSTPVFKYLGLALHNPSVLGTAVIETSSGRWLRAYGGMDHPNIFGGVLAISLIIAAYLLAKKKVLRSKNQIEKSLFLFIFSFIALVALFFTFSRTAWLALALGLVSLFITLIVKKDRWIVGRFLVLMFFTLTMVFIVAYPYRELVLTRVSNNTRLEQKSIQERELYLSQAQKIIKDNWIFGVGVGNYTIALKSYNIPAKTVWSYQPVHNVFLLLWAESGLGALIFFLAFLVFWKKDRRTILAVSLLPALLVLMLFDHWLISLPFGLLFLFLILGLI
jgi:O-antigen ligase